MDSSFKCKLILEKSRRAGNILNFDNDVFLQMKPFCEIVVGDFIEKLWIHQYMFNFW